MSGLRVRPSARVRRSAAQRAHLGVPVTLGARTLWASTKPVADNLVGTRFLPLAGLGAYAASADPRVFNVSPTDFKPYTTHEPPQEGQTLTWHELVYHITHVAYEDVSGDTVGILVYAYRKVI